MSTSSRFQRSGMQVFQGQPTFVRRGRPLPNKGRYFPPQNPLQWFDTACDHWLDQIWDNNAQSVSRMLNPPSFSHFDEVDDNNPEA